MGLGDALHKMLNGAVHAGTLVDRAGAEVGGVLAGVPKAALKTVWAPGGFVVDMATAPWNDADSYNGFLNTLESRAMARFGDFLAPINNLGGGGAGGGTQALRNVGAVDRQIYSYGITRPAVTLIHASGVPGKEGGAHPGAFLNPANWRDAWNSSRDISPGQAAVNATIGTGLRTAGALGVDPATAVRSVPLVGGWLSMGGEGEAGTSSAQLAKPGFDITSPQDRTAFHHGVGRFTSGVVDAVVSWNYDPMVLAGKGAAAFRTAKIIQPITTKTDIGAKVTSGKVTALLSNLETKTPEQRLDWLARNTSLTDPRVSDDGPAIMHLLSHPIPDMSTTLRSAPDALAYPAASGGKRARPPDLEQMRALLRFGMDPSKANAMRLHHESEYLATQARYIKDVRIPTLESVLGPEDHLLRPLTAEQAVAYDAKLEAEAQLKTLDAHGEYLGFLQRAEGSLRNVPRVSAGQRLADATSWSVFQPTKYSLALRVLKSAGTMRANSVDLNRPGQVVAQIARMLDRVGHGFESTPLQGAGMSTEAKGALLGPVVAATNETEQLAAIHGAEYGAVAHLADHLGMDPQVADELVATAQLRKNEARSYYGAGRGTAYSGARKADDSGRYLDEMDLDGNAVRVPMTEVDLANRVPLLDVDQIMRILTQHQATIIADQGGFIDGMRALRGARPDAPRLPGVEPSAHPVPARISTMTEWSTAAMHEVLSKFNRVWKPLQLARLGWTIRVNTDEQTRIIAVTGAMSHLPMVAESVWRPSAAASAAAQSAREELARLDAQLRTPPKGTGPAEQAALQARIDKLEKAVAPKPVLPKSVVRDADGNLLRVYHGTGQTFRRFDDARAAGAMGPGHYFTTDPAHASAYAERGGRGASGGANVRMAYLDLHKVWDAGTDMLTHADAEAIVRSLGEDVSILAGRGPMSSGDLTQLLGTELRLGSEEIGAAVVAHLKAKGYQGLTYRAGKDVREYVVFEGKHVKSPHLTPAEASEKAQQRLHDARNRLLDLEIRAGEGTPWTAEEARAAKAARRIAEGPLLTRPLSRARRAREAAFTEDITAYDRYGRPVTAEGAMAGEEGRIYGDLASSSGDRAFSELADQAATRLAHLRSRSGGESITILPTSTSVVKSERELHTQVYGKAWERAANDQIGQSAIGKRILEGQDDDQIVKWLRSTDPEARALVKRIPPRASDPVRWVGEIRQQVDHYLPTEELRAKALTGKARHRDLKSALGDTHAFPEVHGESLDLAMGEGHISEAWNNIVTKMYRNLGSRPTNLLSRHPYFNAIYKREMAAQTHAYDVAEHEAIPHEAILDMQRTARERALTEVRHTLYDLSNSSNLAHTFRYIAPFYAAWQEALTRWGGLFMEDPSRLARLTQLWESPSKAGLVQTDPSTGHQYIVANIPAFLRDYLLVPSAITDKVAAAIPDTVETIAIPKYWMRDLIAQGTYWMTPGVGAPVAVPLGAFIRHRPDLYDNVRSVLPYGAGADALDQVLPASLRRARSLYKGEDDAAYSQAAVRIAQDLETDRRIAVRSGKPTLTDEQLYAETIKRTNQFFAIRTVANLVLPFSPQFKSPYEGYVQIARNYRDSYLKMPGGRDENGKTWEEKYLEDVGPDYFAFTGSASKTNTGISPTVEGYQATRKYADLIAENPKLGGLIVGDEDAGAFSSEVYADQFRSSTGPGSTDTQRERLSPREALEANQVSQGWGDYIKMARLVDAELLKRPAKALTANSNRDLANLKHALVGALEAKYPAWSDARNTLTLDPTKDVIGFLSAHAADSRYDQRRGWTQVRAYMAGRAQITKILADRYKAGGSSTLGAQSNADLAAIWDTAIGQWKDQSIEFGDIFNRYLDRDLGMTPKPEVATP